jgi:hypothetical protein
VTSRGVRLSVPLSAGRFVGLVDDLWANTKIAPRTTFTNTDGVLLCLNISLQLWQDSRPIKHYLCIVVQRDDSNPLLFRRTAPHFDYVPYVKFESFQFTQTRLYVAQGEIKTKPRFAFQFNGQFVINKLPHATTIIEVEPKHIWDADNQTFNLNPWQNLAGVVLFSVECGYPSLFCVIFGVQDAKPWCELQTDVEDGDWEDNVDYVKSVYETYSSKENFSSSSDRVTKLLECGVPLTVAARRLPGRRIPNGNIANYSLTLSMPPLPRDASSLSSSSPSCKSVDS